MHLLMGPFPARKMGEAGDLLLGRPPDRSITRELHQLDSPEEGEVPDGDGGEALCPADLLDAGRSAGRCRRSLCPADLEAAGDASAPVISKFACIVVYRFAVSLDCGRALRVN